MSRVWSALTLKKARLTRQRGKVLRSIADTLGLVSFGAVDHHKDDHDSIRGLTVSTSHKDKHYAVGAHDGYDIAMVDRHDTIRASGRTEQHLWCIIRVSLREATSLPHVFLLPKGNGSTQFARLFTALRHMQPVNDFFTSAHSHEFHGRYDVMAAPHHAQEIETILTTTHTAGIAARFWPHAVEINNGHLYVYITEHRLSKTVLAGATSSALWLADALDQR